MRSPLELTTVFRARGSKVTPQRQLLFRLLHGNHTHPSAEALYLVASEQMPGISLRTVYQTLNDLASMGELRQITVGTGSTRFDPNVEEHHHMVCLVCGDVRDVYVADQRRPSIDGGGGFDGFDVQSTEIVFRGRCAPCTTTSTRSSPTKETS